MAENPKGNYKGYLFDCDPMPMADDRFGAQVLITRDPETDQVWSELFPALAYFDTEDEAIVYAKQWGVQWVDDHG